MVRVKGKVKVSQIVILSGENSGDISQGNRPPPVSNNIFTRGFSDSKLSGIWPSKSTRVLFVMWGCG